MKTTKQRLLNIIIVMSVAVNLVMLGGIAYIAMLHNYVNNIYSAARVPVVVYVSKTAGNPNVKVPTAAPATP